MKPSIQSLLLGTGLLLSSTLSAQGITAFPPAGGMRPPGAVGATQFSSLQVEVLEEIDFGRVVANRQQAGTVRLDGNRNAVVTGGSEALPGARSITRIRVKGSPNQQVMAMLPSTATLQGPRGTLQLSAFQVLPDAMQTLDASGVATFTIISTLNMPANATDGRYLADVLVSFDYQ